MKTFALLVALIGFALAAPAAAQAPRDAEIEGQGATPAPPDNDGVPQIFTADAREPWTGDFDGMIKRQYVRVLVSPTKTHYMIDRGRERGLMPEQFRAWEVEINRRVRAKAAKGLKHLQVDIQFIPTPRDRLIPDLLEGRGDIIAANLTVTPERREFIDFTLPLITGVREVIVTGPASPKLASLDDLSGQEVYVRRSSSFWGNLERLNERFRAAGKPPITLYPADEHLESEDILELLDAGLIKLAPVDEHIGKFWDQIYEHITVRSDLAIAEGGDIAFAFRKQSPLLKAELDSWIRKTRRKPQAGDEAYRDMLRNLRYAKNSASAQEMRKFNEMAELFKRYGAQYEFDWLMVMAQAYQESGLNQDARSQVGAIGVMQLMRPTAAAPPISIPDIERLERNINAGTKYMRFLADQYFDEPGIDKLNRALFGFAAYNAGPNRIQRMRAAAAQQQLDPNQWFNNVELLVAKKVGREPVQYVSNIYKYYIAYVLATESDQARAGRLREAQRRN